MNRLLFATALLLTTSSISSAQSPELDCVGAGCGETENTCAPACEGNGTCENGTCVAVVCVPDCRDGYSCESGMCTPLPSAPATSACVPNCRSGYMCSAGTCVADPQQTQVPVQHTEPVSEVAVAQVPVEAPVDNEWPREFSLRPLTLPKGVLSTSMGLGVSALRSDFSDTEYFTSFGAGVHLGIIDMLQVSVFPVQLGLSPDLEAFDPLFILRAAFVRTKVFQMGASYGLRIPLADDGVGMINTLQLDFLVRSKVFRFRAAIYASFASEEGDTGPEGEGGASSVTVGSGISMNFGFQLAPIVALDFGLDHYLVDGEPDSYQFSFSPTFVFNIPRGDGTPLMDINAGVSLPGFIGAGRTDPVSARVVVGQLSVSFYNDLY